MFATFFFTMEDYNGISSHKAHMLGTVREMEFFDEYLACLNGFFSPKNDSEAKRLLGTFLGAVTGSFGTAGMKVTESDSNLRRIVIPGELKPDEWPRFRYIFLELWRPADKELADLVCKYRDLCRVDVLRSFIRQKLKAYARAEAIEETQIKEAKRTSLSKEATSQFEAALASLPAGLLDTEKAMLRGLSEKPAPPPPVDEAASTTEEEQV